MCVCGCVARAYIIIYMAFVYRCTTAYECDHQLVNVVSASMIYRTKNVDTLANEPYCAYVCCGAAPEFLLFSILFAIDSTCMALVALEIFTCI